ncbi:MAG: hypothetical protein V3V59_06060 [Thermodesulfovibrionales bacterium]
MKLPRNNKELDELFRSSTVPDVPEFSGEYFVDMLTVLPSLRKISHRKVFHVDNGGVSGCNVLFRRTRWGAFYLEKGMSSEPDPVPVVVINYDRAKNSFLTRRIRDHVRCLEKEMLYLGRFNYVLMGAPRFSGYFSLSKGK